jgi:hypothetical protein
MSSIGADSLSYAELKETTEKLMEPTLPTVFVPKDLFENIPPKMISEQEAIHHCIIKPTEYLTAKLPITDNLLLTEKLKDIIKQKSIKIGVDTEDLPKERYHDRTFPKDYWKKKKAKRRIQKQSRKRK